MRQILIVEDEPKVAKFIQRGLEAEGFRSDVALSGNEAVQLALTNTYDAITLDLMLPERDGYSVIEELKRKQIETPILILSARDELEDKLKGFSLGSDDYLAKPFAFEELLARLTVLIKRHPLSSESHKIIYQDIILDFNTRVVLRADRKIDLTNMEFKLLEFLLRNTGKACSRADIAASVWNESFDRETNIVDVYMMYLRKKIERPNEEPLIRTVRGVGYMIAAL